MAATIPIISFDRFLTGKREDQVAVADDIFNAFANVGFVYLSNHGIPQSQVDEMFALSKRFFELPIEKKLSWKLNDPAVNQGYTADGAEAYKGSDHKECYEHRRFYNGLCPTETEFPGFRETVDSFYKECMLLSQQVLKCLAMVMKLPDDFFDQITTKADPQLRLLHYPAIEKKVLEQEGHARILPHCDFGLCTLLFQDSTGGLEIDPFHTGEFVAAKPVPGTVLINVATLMQRLSNNRVRSTLHRVVSPPAAADGWLPARYSIPFFVHPNAEATIEPVAMAPGEQPLYEPVNAGLWRTQITGNHYKLPVEGEKTITQWVTVD